MRYHLLFALTSFLLSALPAAADMEFPHAIQIAECDPKYGTSTDQHIELFAQFDNEEAGYIVYGKTHMKKMILKVKLENSSKIIATVTDDLMKDLKLVLDPAAPLPYLEVEGTQIQMICDVQPQ